MRFSYVQVMWGGSTMIEAERLLLKSALVDPANQHFVLLSDRLPIVFPILWYCDVCYLFVLFCIHLIVEHYKVQIQDEIYCCNANLFYFCIKHQTVLVYCDGNDILHLAPISNSFLNIKWKQKKRGLDVGPSLCDLFVPVGLKMLVST